MLFRTPRFFFQRLASITHAAAAPAGFLLVAFPFIPPSVQHGAYCCTYGDLLCDGHLVVFLATDYPPPVERTRVGGFN